MHFSSRSSTLVAATTLAVLAICLGWDSTGWDLRLAEQFGGPAGFPLRDNWWLSEVLHAGMRNVAWAITCVLCVLVVWPVGPFRRLPFHRRFQLALGGLIASATVALIKSGSHTSCPYDLSAFGGLAQYRSHWNGWTSSDGGGGHCFPAGHASVGFAFVTGWFALRRDLPALARAWLALALVTGFGLGFVQQVRGAHFMSHTLWTGWICWAVGWLLDLAIDRKSPTRQEAAL
jgi:membrane-associated PAP2 superfamily phosphatase